MKEGTSKTVEALENIRKGFDKKKETLLAFHMDNERRIVTSVILGEWAELVSMVVTAFGNEDFETLMLGGIAIANRNSGGRLLAKLQEWCAKADEIELPAEE